MADNSQIKSIRAALKPFPVGIREFFAELLLYSNLELIILDKDLNILSVSPLLCDKSGYNLHDVSGDSLKNHFPEISQSLKKFVSEKNSFQRTLLNPVSIKTSSGKVLTGSAIASRYQKKNHSFILINFIRLEHRQDHQILNETGRLQEFLLKLTGRGIWILNSGTRQFFGTPQC
ncbi:MAG: PAS domain S-box protein, partial [Bacteroidales bacterium]|nr:PAS domain S-box protein [Bacteroidales bacterium]